MLEPLKTYTCKTRNHFDYHDVKVRTWKTGANEDLLTQKHDYEPSRKYT